MQTKTFKNRVIIISCIILYAIGSVWATTFIVTKTTDTYPTGQSGQLRWAIQQSNRTKGTNQINFKIPGTGPFTITPVKDLDKIINPVVINGYSQTGSRTNTLANGNNALLRIIISGKNYTTGNASAGTGNGLFFAKGSDGSTVKGLVVNAWVNNGIVVYKANNVSILGNFIGTNATGTAQVANQCGIFVETSSNTIIGTSSTTNRNIIAGSFFFFNESACIAINQSSTTSIQNNYIGTNKTGTAALGNSLCGILCVSSNNPIIGSSLSTGRNVISGHTICGISLETVSNAQLQRNYIGTTASGTAALPNLNFGIILSGNGATNSTANNTISNNLISANRVGIKVGLALSGTNQNTIQGNLIGTDYTGKKALGNNYGIIVNDDANTIGGLTTQTRNVVSGNSVGGILLYGSASNNVITGNYIGLDSTGAQALPNGYGIQLGLLGGWGAAGNNTIQNNRFGGGNGTSTRIQTNKELP